MSVPREARHGECRRNSVGLDGTRMGRPLVHSRCLAHRMQLPALRISRIYRFKSRYDQPCAAIKTRVVGNFLQDAAGGLPSPSTVDDISTFIQSSCRNGLCTFLLLVGHALAFVLLAHFHISPSPLHIYTGFPLSKIMLQTS